MRHIKEKDVLTIMFLLLFLALEILYYKGIWKEKTKCNVIIINNYSLMELII